MILLRSIFVLILLSISNILAQEELTWPREFDTKKHTITIYQPQVESFKDNLLEGRMAISIKPKDDDMLFCAAWYKAKMDTDLDERLVFLRSVEITKINFPDVDDQEKIDQLSRVLEKEIESWDVVMSLDRLTASLADADGIQHKSEKLNNDPPEIYFRTSPHTLITIDGDPIIKAIENSNFEYVVNTAFFIVKEKGNNPYFLKGGKFWYSSTEITKGWNDTKNVPKDINKLAEENLPKEEADSISASIASAPTLIVVTKPSEVILTDGEPDYQTIEGTSLLYVRNSESEIIMDVNSQQHYILLAGRWFHSKTLKDGDWKFSEPKDLPEDFAKIPETSDMSTVRASIPGTPENQDALLEQSIPQTATVDRSTTVDVKYDGNPEFKKIDGTEMSYAVNTDKTVLKIANKFYCVDDAIWFVSDNATGPWKVSDVRPDEVDDIPASSEVSNVKYVYVYDSTPEVVYVGYYPGYCHSYVYGGVVVYGTGYWYHPWYRHHYYPRPCTWGFGVHYNPYTGWGFSIGFSYGWVGWGFHPYYRPYWGPRGYHHGYRHGYNRGYRHGARAGYRAGYRAGQGNSARPTPYNNRNVYKNRTDRGVKTQDLKRTSPNDRISSNKARPSTKPNNLYTDRKGNVHQRNKDGSWSQKSNRPATQPKVQQPSTRPNQPKTQQLPSQRPGNKPGGNVQRDRSNQQLNKSYQNRSRGNSNHNRAKSNRSGENRSGGGRRR